MREGGGTEIRDEGSESRTGHLSGCPGSGQGRGGWTVGSDDNDEPSFLLHPTTTLTHPSRNPSRGFEEEGRFGGVEKDLGFGSPVPYPSHPLSRFLSFGPGTETSHSNTLTNVLFGDLSRYSEKHRILF